MKLRLNIKYESYGYSPGQKNLAIIVRKRGTLFGTACKNFIYYNKLIFQEEWKFVTRMKKYEM